MKIIILLLLSVLIYTTKAATITIVGSGNWSSTVPNAPWPGGILPNSSDDIIISGGKILTVDGNFNCASITIGTSVASSNTLTVISGYTLTVSNTITIIPPITSANTNLFNINNGYVNCNGVNSSNSSNNNRVCAISINTGTLQVNGDMILGTTTLRNTFSFLGAGLLKISGMFTGGGTYSTSNGSIEYFGLNQTLNPAITNYNNLIISNSGIKAASATFTIASNLLISGSAQLDMTSTPYNIQVNGDWQVTSSNSDPFIEQTSRVIFAGKSNIQSISTPLTSGETFYNATFNNSYSISPQVSTTSHINITNDLDWTMGALNLSGKNLVITGGTATSALSNGTILTTVAGSSITISDPTDTYTVDFNNFTIGTNTTTGAIPVTMTSNSSTWIGSKFYGATYFTKTGIGADDFAGGNFFYGPSCYFKTTSTAARWRMGNDSPNPDVFYNATFDANGTNAAGATNNNFIVGANSIGNEFYGTTTIISTTSGGFFVGRQNGTGNNSHTFHGPIIINVSLTGNVTIGDATASNTSTVTIENTLQLNSLATSIGDIYIGSTSGYSSIILNASGQIIDGSILGATNVYFNSINQINNLPNSTISGALTNSTIYVANNNSSPTRCIFNGNVNFTSPNINLRGGTFNGINSFQANGSSGQSSYGGNIFNGTSTFINNGTGYWYLGNTVADDYNANIIFNQLSAGALVPCYATNGTFSQNISTVGTNSIITFGGSASGTVTIDGSTNQLFTGSSLLKPHVRKLFMNTLGTGSLTLNVPIDISDNLSLVNGLICTTTSNSLTLTDESVVTSIGNSNSYVNGPLIYVCNSNSIANLNLPIGKNGDWRPAIINVKHNSTTSYYYCAELFNSSAEALNWTKPSSITHVSKVHWWDINRFEKSSGISSPTTNVSGTQTVTLYYGINDDVTDPNNLTICKNTYTSSTVWDDIGGNGASQTTGSITSTSMPNSFTSFSRFTLGNRITGNNLLPNKLISFNAFKNTEHVDLKWETVSESQINYYEIEKSSNGTVFEHIETIYDEYPGRKSSYSVIDYNPFYPTSYYRLRFVDFNGQSAYSQIKSVELIKTNNIVFNLFPNPNDGLNFNLYFEGDINQEIYIEIYDVDEKHMFSKCFNFKSEKNSVINISPKNNLEPGVYFVVIKHNQQTCRKKMVVF